MSASPVVEYAQITQVESSAGDIIDVNPLPALTNEEDTFCLAVIEYGGNLKSAYISAFGHDSNTPATSARRLLGRPEIALRIRELTEVVADNALISLGSHLVELADIRDLAKMTGQLKVALNAEEARGRVAGFYIGKEGANAKVPQGATVVMVSVTTQHDAHI